MNQPPERSSSEHALLARVEALLADSALRDHPLRQVLAELYDYSEGQRARLERLVRISDGYHTLSRDANLTLAERYDKQLRRLEKLARISDRYQNSLRELSEAMKEAAMRDPLTELGNRRFLMDRLREETERANRKGVAYALGMLDVDHFKRINDCFGHENGDRVLREVGPAIRAALREYDLCGRWGGEEFLILLPETPLEPALQVAERVRNNIARIGAELPGGVDLVITASIGMTLYTLGESFSETLNRADHALLLAKTAGRDRVETG